MINKLYHAKRYIALFLTAVMCLCIMTPGEIFASKTGEGGIDFATGVVNIDSSEDFKKFADECRSQNYSLAKTFVLNADIDISAYPDLTVAYLDGVFEGQGHTISGLVIDEDISDCGLFRYVGESGAVYDLKVQAQVVFGEDQKNSGILAGTNRGEIVRCKSAGSLNARSQVGGIAGHNEKSGVIRDCVNEASIDGKFRTGGIVGLNEGVVSRCINKGSININTRIKNSSKTGTSDTVNISIPNAVTGFAADERANETGGVAGCSKGDLLYCENEGSVGYKELGTDTGGITGRLSGCVMGCENRGTVKGRRNVGGIVGFLDPFRAVSLDRDYYDDIQEEFDRMDAALVNALDSGEKIGDDVYGGFYDITDRVKELKNVVRTYVDEYDADVRSTRRNISAQADEIEDVIDKMDYNFRLKKLAKYEKELKEDLEQIIELTDHLEKLIPTLDEEKAGALIETVKKYEEIIDSLKSLQEQIHAIIEALEKGDIDGDSLSENEIPSLSSIEPLDLPEMEEDDKKLSEELTDLLMNYKEAAETIERIKFFYRDAFARLDDISDVIERWPKLFKRIKKNLRTISDDAQVIRDISDGMMDRMEYRTDAMKLDVRVRSDDISDRVDVTRDVLYDDWKRFFDDMDEVRRDFDSLRTTMEDGRDDIKKIIEDKTMYVDVSDDVNVSPADGKILYCVNDGEVRADSCAGGVAGCIDIEEVKDDAVDIFERYRYNGGEQDVEDEEDDEDDEKQEKDSLIHHVRALIYECKNSSDVICDDGYAGGVAGKARYGVIAESSSYADIDAGDGKYAGGVAGYSKLTVSGCYVFGGVSASSYVGGIAGKGNVIRDTISCSYMDMEETVVKATGALAGKASGEVTGNYFVDNGFGAVDDVTKEGEAVAMSYDRLVGTFDVPEEFKKFTIRFVDRDQTVWSKEFVYDEPFPKEDYPELKENEGEYAYWEDKDLSPVVRNVTVHGVRRVYVPSVASKPEDDETLSYLVLEGDFYPDSVLSVREAEAEEVEALNAVKQRTIPQSRLMISQAYKYEIHQERELNPLVRIRAMNFLFPANKILVVDKDMNPVDMTGMATESDITSDGTGDESEDIIISGTGLVDAATVGSYADAKALICDEGYIVLMRYVTRKNMMVIILVMIISIAIFGFAIFWMRKQRKKRLKGAMSSLQDTGDEGTVGDEDALEDEGAPDGDALEDEGAPDGDDFEDEEFSEEDGI